MTLTYNAVIPPFGRLVCFGFGTEKTAWFTDGKTISRHLVSELEKIIRPLENSGSSEPGLSFPPIKFET